MAYVFNRKATGRFQFNRTEGSSDQMKLDGINATLTSADTICDGVASLMAIGSNEPVFLNGTRTVTDNVDEDY